MSNYPIIIYDCDGVLIDSREANAAFYNHILSRFGLPPLTPRQLDVVHMLTSEGAVAYLFQGHSALEEALSYQKNVDNTPFFSLLRLEPHVREVLERLRPAHRLAIATNRGKSLAPILKRLEIAALFDLTVSSYDVTRPKPHPECLQKILAHFQAEPGQTLYLGDSPLDQEVAARAAVPFAAYKNPGLPARYHLEDHLELLEILCDDKSCPPEPAG
jgi:phosphoglycolate phosphatase